MSTTIYCIMRNVHNRRHRQFCHTFVSVAYKDKKVAELALKEFSKHAQKESTSNVFSSYYIEPVIFNEHLLEED